MINSKKGLKKKRTKTTIKLRVENVHFYTYNIF